MKCSSCSTENEPDSVFCDHCGQPLAKAAPVPVQDVPSTKPQRLDALAITVGAIVIIVGVLHLSPLNLGRLGHQGQHSVAALRIEVVQQASLLDVSEDDRQHLIDDLRVRGKERSGFLEASSDPLLRLANLLVSDGTLTRPKLDDWNHYFQSRENPDQSALIEHIHQLTIADLARLKIKIAEQQADEPLVQALSEKRRVYSDLYYKDHNYAEIVRQFNADQSLFRSTRTVAIGFGAMSFSEVADSYEKEGDRKKAAVCYILAAKYMSSEMPGTSIVDDYLAKAKRLDPTNRDIETFQRELAVRPSYAIAKASRRRIERGSAANNLIHPDETVYRIELSNLVNLYQHGDMKGLINRFKTDEPVYFKGDETSKLRLLEIAPGIGDAYSRLKENREAAHYFAVAAKTQKDVSPEDPRFKLYLDRAAQLDPDNPDVKALQN